MRELTKIRVLEEIVKTQFIKYQEIIDSQNKVVKKLTEKSARDSDIIQVLKRDNAKKHSVIVIQAFVIAILILLLIFSL